MDNSVAVEAEHAERDTKAGEEESDAVGKKQVKAVVAVDVAGGVV